MANFKALYVGMKQIFIMIFDREVTVSYYFDPFKNSTTTDRTEI